MFKFEREQTVYDIAGVKIGGQPGEYPTVLIGSIFYDKHRIVSNPKRGEFNREAAETLIKKQEELFDRTGNPFILDVVGSSKEALIKYIDFVSKVTEAPFLVDGPSAEVRIPAAKHAVETGLKERGIYNSLDQHVKPEEVASLRELGVQSSVLMAFDPRNAWPEGRLNILRGYEGQTGLLEAAKQAGLQKTLVDTAVLDVPSIGLASKATQLVKEECGLPTGCGPSNAVSTWKRVKMEYAFPAYPTCLASSAVVALMAYADFVLYGPIEYAETVFPACAMTDAIIAYAARRLGTRTKTKDHPLFKIF